MCSNKMHEEKSDQHIQQRPLTRKPHRLRESPRQTPPPACTRRPAPKNTANTSATNPAAQQNTRQSNSPPPPSTPAAPPAPSEMPSLCIVSSTGTQPVLRQPIAMTRSATSSRANARNLLLLLNLCPLRLCALSCNFFVFISLRHYVFTSSHPLCRNKITSPSCTIYSFPSNRTCAFSRAAAILPAASKSLHFTTSARINPFSISL